MNYRPVSLLASSSKICEKIFFFYLNNFWWRLVFFINFSLVSDLVIQQSSNWFPLYKREVRAVFLDISKAFDKVWHAGLLCKLEALGVQPLLLQLFESYLLNRKQRVVQYRRAILWFANSQHRSPSRVFDRTASIFYLYQWYYWWSRLSSFDLCRWYYTVHEPAVSAGCLNSYLNKISGWAAPDW